MKMEVAMTERDKKLLIFLGLFVVIVGVGYWGVRPAIVKSINLHKEIAVAEQIQRKNQEKLMELPMLRVDSEKMEEEILTVRGDYYPMMSSDAIDKYFTGIVLDYNLYAYDLSINMPTDCTDLEPYKYSEKALNPPEEEWIPELEEDPQLVLNSQESEQLEAIEAQIEEEPEFVEDPDNGIYAATVNMRLGGEQAQLSKLIDDLSNTKQKMRICNYSYATEREIVGATDGDYSVVENRVLYVTIEIYMVEE